MDLSFVKAMGEIADCHYLLDVYPKLRRATALDLDDLPKDAGIYPLGHFPTLHHFSPMLDAGKCHLIVRSQDFPLHPSNLLLQGKLMRHILELKPDIIHFNNQIYFTHFYLFLLPMVKLISIHDPFPHSGEEAEAEKFSQKLYCWLNANFIRHHLLYNDLMVSQYAESRGVETERVVTSSLGPYEYLQHLPQSDAPSCDFLFFGRIQKYKGLDDLLDAFSLVLQTHPEAKLIIAGSGKLWFDLGRYGIPERNLVFLNRFIPPAELANLLRRCRVVVCPYKDATQSGVVMSAYALKKPVIVTNVGALATVVEDGQTGWVVPASSPESLGQVMNQVMSRDDSILDSMSARIEQLYLRGARSWNAIAYQLLGKYQDVLNK
jgi:glycosyltransferase involved in cell wall biosynthesis